MIKYKVITLLITFTLITSLQIKLAKSNNIKYKLNIPKPYYELDATYYRPNIYECDSTPLITANNSFIDTNKLKQGKIKWIAISRDLITQIPLGSTVYIENDNCSIEGVYKVMDKMNKKHKNKIDILCYDKIKIIGKVKLTKI